MTGVDVPRPSSPQPPSSRAASPGIGIVPPDLTTIRRAILIAWAAATATIVLAFGTRVARFRRTLLGGALPPPTWIEDEARRVARSIGVRAPEILLIPAATTPMLWFLGRPRLLLPARLVDILGADAWRGILAHELAHLLRRDHWVRRLELLAGLLWWWNPIYWLTRRRLEAEAELACDEWAIRAFPEGRFAYAEALLEVCRNLSPPVSPAPALGVVGSGRYLERRITMILRDPALSRASTPALFGAALLSLVAIPGWSATGSAAPRLAEAPASFSRTADPEAVVQGDDDDTEAAKADERARRDEERARRDEERAERQEERAKVAAKAKGRSSASAKQESVNEKEVAEKAEVFARKGEQVAREMEAKFGPDSEFVKEIEEKLGPGSEFANRFDKSKSEFTPDRKSGEDDPKPKAKIAGKAKSADTARQAKARQVAELRKQIEQFSKSLRALEKEEGDEDEQEEKDGKSS